MFLGIDVSTYLEEQRLTHQKYFQDGQEIDPFLLFKNNGVTHLRTRIWNNPYDENGEPYLGGTCDLSNFISLHKELEKYEFKNILDFHYSDFWVDPSKQFLPKAWQNLTFDELVNAIYEYTKETLLKVKEAGIELEYIQTGNEITHGFLWPYGQLLYHEKREESFDRFASLLKSAIKACNEIYPFAKVIIHLEQSYDQELYRDILTNLLKRNVKIDTLGVSYYPFWHHGFDEFFANMDMVSREFNLPIINVEVGYPFTLVDYRQDVEGEPKHMVINDDNIDEYLKVMPYYPDIVGQAKFIKDYVALAKKHNLVGICYWEPLWVPGNGICWTSREAQKYMHDNKKDIRNEWANQCLFDYDANALPALEEFKK